MIKQLAHWLAPPVFPEDEEKTNLFALLNVILLGPILLMLVYLVVFYLDRSLPRALLVIDLTALALTLLGLRWLHAAKATAVIATVALVGYLAITATNISLGTIRTPTASLYLFWVLMAGVVFRLRGLLLATSASSLTILGLILAESAGLLPKPDYRVGLTQWLSYTGIFAMAAGLIYYANERTRLALERAENEIAQRQRTEEQLKTNLGSLQLSEQALNQISQGVLISDARRRLVYVNDEAERLTGYSRQDLLGQSCALLQGPASDAATVLRMRQALDNWQAFTGEILNYRKDGTPFWNELSITPVFDAAGRLSQFVGVQRDISARKRREAEAVQQANALREGHDMLQSILSATTDGYLRIDDKGHLLDANARYGELSGYTREELLQTRLSDLMLVSDVAEIAERQRLIVACGNLQFESRHRRKDGSVWDVEVSAGYRREAGNQFFVFLRDISGRKRREEELRQLSEAIAQSTESIVITNPQADIEYVNDAYLKSTGYSRSELIGRNSRLLQSGKTARATYESLWQTLRQGQSWSGEFFNRRKDGSEYIEAAIISPIRGADGQIRSYVAAKRDVTQAKQIELELQQARQAADAANLAKSQFLATMSHEVRTPLNGILGMAQVLLMPRISQAERQDYARTIVASGQTLLNLLNDILDLAKIEAGRVEIDAIAMAPHEILAQTQALFGSAARAKGLRIESSWLGPRAHYRGDPHRLAQMLSNLVSNALKFTARGSIRVEAREIARTAGRATLEFSVSDSGIGIAPDKLGLLFQSFSQVDSSSARQFGGTGLGLSIVRTLAHLMGGAAGVESDLGRGSRFWFRVAAEPVAQTSGEASEPLAHDAVGAQTATLHPGRVLLVEDNVIHRRLLEVLLGSLGMEVLAASNGQQGLDAIVQGESAPVILMDLHMPLLDGYEATRRIRQWEQQNSQRRRVILALTADAYEDAQQRCLAAGVDDVLTKPVSFDQLKAMLARWQPDSAAPVPQPPYTAIDVARVLAQMGELEPLLENLDFDAIARFRALEEGLAGTELAAQLAPAAHALQTYQFDVVLQVLRQIMNNPDWQGETA